MRELLIGAGHRRVKELTVNDSKKFENLTTLDINEYCADVVWDLNNRPLPFDDETFDEIHAYEILEHVGRLGDAVGFFEEWAEYWRILKPLGVFCGSCPKWDSYIAWCDPSHSRIITPHTLKFLDQNYIKEKIDSGTNMSDFRNIWKLNFNLVYLNEDASDDKFYFILQKV